MTLARLSPDNYRGWFPTVPSLFDRFFEGDLMDWNSLNFSGNNSTLPAVNVKENENEYLIDVAAPGLKKDDFKLSYDNGKLTISSEKKEESEDSRKLSGGEKVTRREFSYQSFQRTFNVPENVVNAEGIKAKYEDGILHVTLPKLDEVKPKPAKQIEIS